MNENPRDGAQALADISGLSRGDIIELWREVKLNRERLEGCAGHLFETMAIDVRLGRSRFRCRHCTGVVELTALGWYRRGFAAAGGDPDTLTVEPWGESKKKAGPEGPA
jgi:hypothetical protein